MKHMDWKCARQVLAFLTDGVSNDAALPKRLIWSWCVWCSSNVKAIITSVRTFRYRAVIRKSKPYWDVAALPVLSLIQWIKFDRSACTSFQHSNRLSTPTWQPQKLPNRQVHLVYTENTKICTHFKTRYQFGQSLFLFENYTSIFVSFESAVWYIPSTFWTEIDNIVRYQNASKYKCYQCIVLSEGFGVSVLLELRCRPVDSMPIGRGDKNCVEVR